MARNQQAVGVLRGERRSSRIVEMSVDLEGKEICRFSWAGVSSDAVSAPVCV